MTDDAAGAAGSVPARPLICAHNLSYAYPNGVQALDGVHLDVEAGARVSLVGPNGAGKTTLLKILLGMLEGWTGSVEIGGLAPNEARRHGGIVAWAPQRPGVNWEFPITVRETIELGRGARPKWFGRLSADDRAWIDSLLDRLDIADLAERRIGALSGGQQQRVMIARALAARPQALLLDEPSTGVDAAGQQRFQQLLDTLHDDFGLTLLVVSHDLPTVIRHTDRVACLNRTLHFHDVPHRLSETLLSEVFHCSLDGVLPEARGACDHEHAYVHASGESDV